jgi:hypothetical protein
MEKFKRHFKRKAENRAEKEAKKQIVTRFLLQIEAGVCA